MNRILLALALACATTATAQSWNDPGTLAITDTVRVAAVPPTADHSVLRFSRGEMTLLLLDATGTLHFNSLATVDFSPMSYVDRAGPKIGYLQVRIGNVPVLLAVHAMPAPVGVTP
jgi:hypothetical protein